MFLLSRILFVVSSKQAHFFGDEPNTLTKYSQDTFGTGDVEEYVGPGGGVLLRLPKSGSSLETLVLSKPLLALR